MMVKVSARILHVPSVCVCCCREAADGTFRAAYTRVTGKRVIRTQEKGWEFRICATCLAHIDLARQEATARTNRNWSIIAGVICGLIGLIAVVPSPIIGVLLLLASAGCLAFLAPSFSKEAEKFRADLDEHLSESCCDLLEPVVYLGWDGSIHAFEFRSLEYAAIFSDANRKKVLG